MALTTVLGSVWDSRDNNLVVNIKDMGAIGDGVTDDTAAIQSALDFVEAQNGGTVWIPTGTYIVTDTLTVSGIGTVIAGAGATVEDMFLTSVTPRGSVIKLKDGAFNSASKAIIQCLYAGGGSDLRLGVTIRDLAVFGNRSLDTADPSDANANNNNAFGIGIQVVGSRYVTLENVYCLWCAEDGIQTISGTGITNNFMANRCACIANVDDGIDFAGGDSMISNNQCGFNGGDGMSISGLTNLVGNLCWDNFANGLRITASDTVVTGGQYYDNQAAGILVSGTLTRIVINGVVCQDNGKDTGLTDNERSGILISGASDVSVAGAGLSNKDGTTQTYGLRASVPTDQVEYTGVTEGGTANSVAFISVLAPADNVISAGVISFTGSRPIRFIRVDTEAMAAADDLDTLTGATEGEVVVLQIANNARIVTYKDGTGNLILAGDFVPASTSDKLTLIKVSNDFHELSRSTN